MAALIVYLLFGLALAWRLLPELRGAEKCWLGLVFGCIAMMWLPCIPAFFLGYTAASCYIAAGLSLAGAIFLSVRPLRNMKWNTPEGSDAVGLMVSGLMTLFCAYLLYTHVLRPESDGSLWVGQSTYGDLAMHLGFIEGLFQQGTFPPEYTIYPGQMLNYPFLVDAASAGLMFFGLSLRWAVILPSLVMLFCVFFGFWLLADGILKRLAPVLSAWLLFVFNGGFGFCYFLGKYDFSEIFSGYYTTPTNLVEEDIRWVNVICDMLIPQRTTMAGWCVILAAIFLLIRLLRKTLSGEPAAREAIILAVTAGAMPMIHTHSFLALGILSAAWFFACLPKAIREKKSLALFTNYVIFGAICLSLALPQILKWTMSSVKDGNLLQWNLGWVSGDNNWLVFYGVNVGVVFIAMWPMLFFLRGENARLFIGAAAIFVIANVAAFQPNLYDNNKLLYIWYMLTDILVCGWLWDCLYAMKYRHIRSFVAACILFFGMFSGFLSMLRESVGEYQLLSKNQVDAAEFILNYTEPDSTFLTSTAHTNPVPILTGRNILVGSSLYLYFHGVNYSEREQKLAVMYEGGELFEQYARELGVDYVYISGNEYSEYNVNYDYFFSNYPLVYSNAEISIFQIS